GVGTAPRLSVIDNLVLTSFDRPPFSLYGILRKRRIKTHARRLIKDFEVSVPDEDMPAAHLSGGNLQKIILARELSAAPRLLLAVHPTRGLDIGASERIRRLLMERRNSGVAIILISEDLSELMALSDRIAVLCAGRITGVVPAATANIQSLGMMMGGTNGGSAD
ncbi:heme ABC transporter ATP-binding protein, partial [bacterium]|nr:heme ABC transporter ATP-binding protein [candidate division CSSED10-310 bacterium]